MPQRRAFPTIERNALPIFIVLLVLALFAAYRGVLHYPFIFDDVTAIPKNRTLTSFATALHPPEDTTMSGRPLVNLSFAFNRAISGDSLPAYHLTNVVILVGCALLLFGLVRRTLPRLGPDWAERAGAIALAASLVWALHPLQTESVTYLVQRAESLMGFCYLAVLYGVARCAEPSASPRAAVGWAIFAAHFCWLGMAAKEVMISAPVVAFAFDAVFFSAGWRETLKKRWPLYAVMLASWLLVILLAVSTGWRSGGAGLAAKFEWTRFLRTEAYGVMRYLRLSFWPSDQVLDYGTHWIDAPAAWVPSALAVVTLGILSLVALYRRQPLGWLGLWFFSVLAPTSLVPVPRQTLAEHRMFLALAPLVIAVTALLVRWAGIRSLALLAAAAAALTVVAARRNRVYQSDFSIWNDGVAKLPSNAFNQNNLGHAFYEQHRYAEAESHILTALQLEPGYAEAWCNLGVLQDHKGLLPDAEVSYRRSIEYNPKSAPARNDFANLLVATGRLNEAVDQLQKAIALDPYFPEAHNDYGNALVGLGRMPEAEAQFRLALNLDPNNDQAHNGMGTIFLKHGQLDAAREQFAIAEKLNPDLAQAYANDGEALEHLGRRAEALQAYQKAVETDPKSGDIRYNYGNVVFHTGDYARAAELYEAAIRLKPGLTVAHYNLAVTLYHLGKVAPAAEEFAATVRLDPDNADAHNNYGAVLLALGHPAEALAQFQIVEKLSPQLPGLAGNLAAARKALSQR